MPVRIIFRGLVLFKVVEGDDGVIEAKLVDAPTGHGHSMLHQHQAEAQVYSRASKDGKEQDVFELVPLEKNKENVDIQFVNAKTRKVTKAQSYLDFCPRLSDIMANTKAFSAIGSHSGHGVATHADQFVRNRVTIHGGTIRVKNVVSWDAGAFPLPLEEGVPGLADPRPTIELPAEVKFVGSTTHGHVASECIVDVDADGVKIGGQLKNLSPGDRYGGKEDSVRVPKRTVEILITNFPPQRDKALPWSAHFRWLLQAAGYSPIAINDDEFKEFEAFATKYNPTALTTDLPLLKGAERFPVPWIDKLTPVGLIPVNHAHAAHDPWNRPLCPQGDE